MSSSTPSKLPASAPTVLELGNRRSLEVSRTSPSTEAPARLALGTNPPSSNGLDAHLIAIGTPTPRAVASSSVASNHSASNHSASNHSASKARVPEPKTVFLGAGAFVSPSRAVTNAPRSSVALAVLFGMLALAIAPLAPIAWMHAAEQLDLIARGLRREGGRRVLHAVQGIGIAMTMVAVAATAFGATVLLARYLR